MRLTGKTALLVLLFAVSCKTPENIADENDQEVPYEAFYTISDSTGRAADMEHWLEPYRGMYRQKMSRRIAVAEGSFGYGRPESSLGNLLADMIRYRASREMQAFVHLSVIPRGLIRTGLEQGAVTLGDLHELAPGNDTLVILEVKGSGINDLAAEIAASGGVPLSGMRMTLSGGEATGILLNSGSPDPEQTYYVATSSEALSGGEFRSLQQSLNRHEFPLLIRDLFVEYMRSRRVFTPLEDQRIRTR